ncbi:anti-phage ZorAB system protein ZorA [Shewanella sp.]|uniref:anti-phage ZorAB system protein ZorA n=1 Tax=Shewanella sp. TaxID=50422 RepID=UPI001EBCC029|nr:anti-phage ZorAB system protein ZorA [Shewanella sp.]NRB24587.1 anti-phage defense ZorAB system ZorA [Shewanella sp.]
MNSSLDFTPLIPQFELLKSGVFTTTASLSAFIVLVLIITFTIACCLSVYAGFKTYRRTSLVRKIIKGKETATVLHERSDMLEKSEPITVVHDLWSEFDETLVEVETPNGQALYNTVDAEYFFNTTTLARGATESRMAAAVPGFLTAIGVIGTFVGLQLGLGGLQLDAGASVEQLREGIGGMINGAAVAFMTSVYGVALSLIYNFIEKCLERRARTRVMNVQSQLDRLFPRLSAESQLVRIASDGEQSKDVLLGLAEKIGDKLQEALIESSQQIQTGLEASLEKIMAPAINKLVDQTSEGNQQALEGLLEKFMDGFGSQGQEQRIAMDSASGKINEAISSMSQTMQSFVTKMEHTQTQASTREKDLAEQIKNQVNELVAHSYEQKQTLTKLIDENLSNIEEQTKQRDIAEKTNRDKADTLFSQHIQQTTQISEDMSANISTATQQMQTALEKQINDNSEKESLRQNALMDQTTELKSSTESLLKQVEQLVTAQVQATSNLLVQGKALQEGIDASVRSNLDASSNMKLTSEQLNVAASSMNVMGSNIKEAGNQLSGAVTEAVHTTKDLAAQNQATAERMQDLRTKLNEDYQSHTVITDNLMQIIDSADSSFDKMKDHQQAYLNELQQNVISLKDHLNNLLVEYGNHVNDQTTARLNVWNEQTSEYTGQMTSAMKALSSVIDEIETKTGRQVA